MTSDTTTARTTMMTPFQEGSSPRTHLLRLGILEGGVSSVATVAVIGSSASHRAPCRIVGLSVTLERAQEFLETLVVALKGVL